MKNRTCAAFIFDGFADHQLSMAMGCLSRTGEPFTLETFSIRGRVAVSSSGLRVMPHASLSCMDPEDFDVLLLPGGLQWERGDTIEVFPLITAIFGNKPLIAIGEATLALADLGLLNDIPHTGPGREYFERFCPDYAGFRWFRDQPCVAAGSIVTVAAGAAGSFAGGAGVSFAPPDDSFLGLFDTLQEIYAKNHELFDPARKGEPA
jgi:putative intracellular protease/amidase